jgi:hypothetical protein
MFKGSNQVQLKRFLRLAVFTIVTQLPLLLSADGVTWKNLVSLVGVPLFEVLYRMLEPATPDVATSPPAAADGAIPPLG